MPRRAPLARRARELADALEAMEQYPKDDDWLTPHEKTRRLLETRGVNREQLNYAVPEDLKLKQRLAAYNAENGSPGPGNIVAAVLDSFLRAHGYPPEAEELH